MNSVWKTTLFKLAKELEKLHWKTTTSFPQALPQRGLLLRYRAARHPRIPVKLFTGIFALARTVGWIAQLNEMVPTPEYKIGRPRQLFTGAECRDVLPATK